MTKDVWADSRAWSVRDVDGVVHRAFLRATDTRFGCTDCGRDYTEDKPMLDAAYHGVMVHPMAAVESPPNCVWCVAS